MEKREFYLFKHAVHVPIVAMLILFSQKSWSPRGIYKTVLSFRNTHTIIPGTPEHRTTEHGKPAEHRNTNGTTEYWQKSEYHGIVEQEKSRGAKTEY